VSAAAAGGGVTNLRDTISECIIGMTTAGPFGQGQDTFNVGLAGRRFNFERYDALDRYEYEGNGKLKWRLRDSVTTILRPLGRITRDPLNRSMQHEHEVRWQECQRRGFPAVAR
jgi:hypothetical protein